MQQNGQTLIQPSSDFEIYRFVDKTSKKDGNVFLVLTTEAAIKHANFFSVS